MNGEQLTIALAKGRLADQTASLLEACGVDTHEVRDPGRRLVLFGGPYRFLLVKPGDVPTYVDHGAADVGIVGKDTLMEEGRPLYELLDLGLGKCRLCIAGDPERHRQALAAAVYRVATKYPNIASSLYAGRGLPVEIIYLGGSVELAPIIGLSDVILDIVESGGTLRANGLTILEEVCAVSARLVVNRVALKTKTAAIRALAAALVSQTKPERGNP
jgi:ATP phosphoribosyltransferase